MANILIVNSSPRNNSNTRILAAKVKEGAEKSGHSVKTMEIGKADIHACIGCEVCHTKTQGKCVFDDAMTELYAEIARAEVILFASPIYYFTINAQMKLFIDRCYAIGAEGLAGKRLGGIFVYGDVDPVKSGCINAIRMFQDICAYLSIKWLGAVYGTAYDEGEVAKNPALLDDAIEYGGSL